MQNRVKITLIMVSSIDGVIANGSHPDSFAWNSKEDKQNFRLLTKAIGTVIMGSKTFEASMGATLNGRKNLIFTSDPTRFEPHKNAIYYSGNVEEGIKLLSDQGVTHAALIGGANLNGQFLKAGLIDEIVLTIEPIIFGQGLTIFGDTEFEKKLKIKSVRKLNDSGSLLLTYSVIKDGFK